jgi:hypothetical protein
MKPVDRIANFLVRLLVDKSRRSKPTRFESHIGPPVNDQQRFPVSHRLFREMGMCIGTSPAENVT